MKNIFLLLSLFSCSFIVTQAQTNGSNSSYSRYGFGLLNHRSNAAATAMSGVSIANRDSKTLNPLNPASFSCIDSLSLLFDVGLTLQNGNFKFQQQKTNAKNTSIDYITTGFRIAPNLGIGIGLSPFSTIGYSTKSSSFHHNDFGGITEYSSFEGNGGLHEAYAGIGWAPIRNFSIGVNAGYLWGDMTHSVVVNYSDPLINTRKREFHAHPKTYKLDFGLQYQQTINKKNSITVGAIYGMGHKISSPSSFYDQRIEQNNIIGDTLKVKNAFELPHSFGIGLSWNYKANLKIGFDYQRHFWNNTRTPQLKENNQYIVSKNLLSNSERYAFGAEYINNPYGLRPYQHIRYRIGTSFTTPYTKINGQKGPKRYEVSMGVGIPIINYHGQPTNRSILNLGISYEHVKPTHIGFITENYLKIHIGLTFNERWFAKWKAQ